MNSRLKLVTLGIVRDNQDRVLICQRYEPQLAEVHLKWDLPGGTNEVGEKLKDTLKREILEETGLEIDVRNFIPKPITKTWDYQSHKQHTLVLCFNCKLISGELNLNDHKINNLKWVELNKLKSYSFLSTTDQIINTLV